ncbi:hypothetical protein Leryth_016863 [Lithospermum erythrorhizon]|nr:hypothetical protein Leryth_016863 [Lithospermum erythrorhizon]
MAHNKSKMPSISCTKTTICLHLYSPIHQQKPIKTSQFSTCNISSFLFRLKPKRFHLLRPCCSSLKESKKKKTLIKSPVNAPNSLKGIFNINPKGDSSSNNDGGDGDSAAVKGTILAGLLLVGVVGGFGGVGYIYRDQINAFLNQFSGFIEGYGPAGYAIFVAVYAGLEVLAIPAIPLTMSAGLLFGTVTGTIIVSINWNCGSKRCLFDCQIFCS